ncbi:SPP1 gp7 family putative phage head morphogenesis protein [Fusobacterium sp. PH5-7]|uniref:minor capsid protein n=1 Tax=Fusobacterium sp. PH5-7 TaxID=2940528 RepID=UPI00247655FB|nr:minor capsid protein [Fusobacterium sp. PH5-7]MDH6459675.1 SPP1 gp7 family putative phage head morphogenesis protein [Fusobacterium sp. PH5-7]
MKNKAYWDKRQRERERKVYKTTIQSEKALKIEIMKAQERILADINNLIGKYMSETGLSYAEAQKKLNSNEYKVWRKDLEGYLKELKQYKDINFEKYKEIKLELETLAMKSRISRLESLIVQTNQVINKQKFEEEKEVANRVREIYKTTFKSVQADIGLKGVNTILPLKQIERAIQYPWSGENFSERIWRNRDKLSRVLKTEITQSLIQGVNPQKLNKRIREQMGSGYKETQRLVRTELNYALNEATKIVYEEDEIEEYEFLAEIDNRTSAICKGFHGQVFKVKDAVVGVNYPPMHPNCRSTTIPVIK